MKKELYVVHVRYQPGSHGKEYAYLYDPSKIPLKRGDEILVPVGSSGKQARCEVSRVKGLVDSLDKGIKYKTLDVESVLMSKSLLEQEKRLEAQLAEREKEQRDNWERLAETIQDF